MAKRAILAMAVAAFAVLFSASALADWSVSLEYNRYYNYHYSNTSSYYGGSAYPYTYGSSYYGGYYYPSSYSTSSYYSGYGNTRYSDTTTYIPDDYSNYSYWRYFLFPNMSYGRAARAIYDTTYPSATSNSARRSNWSNHPGYRLL